jgi:DNA-binding beta-propeller fold protein YncE
MGAWRRFPGPHPHDRKPRDRSGAGLPHGRHRAAWLMRACWPNANLRTAAGRVIAHALLLGSASVLLGAGPPPPLTLEQKIQLHAVSGRIDHMAVDLGRRRLFVAELGNGTVDVVDLASAQVIHRIEGLREPQGIGYASAQDMLAVASAGDGSVRLFKAADFAPRGSVKLGEDADNVRVGPQSGMFLIGYGRGAIATLDGVSGQVVGRAALPAHPEGFQLDPLTRRIFVNVPDAGQIAVVDLQAGKQVATWRIPGLAANFPMAIDHERRLVVVAYRSPARLVLLDAGSGSVKARLDTCGDADDVSVDPKRQRIYVSCGSGSIDTFTADGSSYRFTARIGTVSGARTSLFVPELDRLFVAQRAGLLGSEAALLVFSPDP